MARIEIGGGPEESTALIDEVVSGLGVAVVDADDPDDFAIEFTDRLDADLLDAPADLDDLLVEIRAVLDARADALAALEIHARGESPSGAGGHVVTDVAALRRLVERIRAAEDLVEASRRAVTERLRSAAGTGVAVHPDAIRAAAAEVRNERAAMASLDAEIAELEAAAPPEDEPADEPVDGPARKDVVRTWDDNERRSMIRAAVATGAALVGAVALLVASSTALGFVVPALLVVWMVVLFRRNQRGLAGYDVASDNLAAVTALTDRAYGGVARVVRTPELIELDRRRSDAADRLRYAESRWVGLVGTEVDAASVDDWLATREPSHRISDAELAQTPSIRVAGAQLRRLEAQWKLAWYVLDRPVPDLVAATASLDALTDEGIEQLSVDTYERRRDDRSGDEDRFAELAGGRTVDELRAAAAVTPRPVVVLDADRSLAVDEFERRTQDLPPDVRIVLVRPRSAG